MGSLNSTITAITQTRGQRGIVFRTKINVFNYSIVCHYGHLSLAMTTTVVDFPDSHTKAHRPGLMGQDIQRASA